MFETQPHLARRRRPRRHRLFVFIVSVACVLGLYACNRWMPSPHLAISGRARVIDGDTIRIAGIPIRLEGIDAPERDQTCDDANGKPWPCGVAATRRLRERAARQSVSCRPRAIDRYGRVVAACSLPDGSDINAWMVREGWAVAYGFAKIYFAEELEAKAAKRGIWAGSFVPPADWRRHKTD
jgi:endonuclease YncB( thermonuclease family)